MEYLSLFAPHIIGLIEQKRAIGYKYASEVGILRRFDAFCVKKYPNESVLNRDIVLDWATKRPEEKAATLQNRITPVKELTKYMVRLGLEAFILPKGMMRRVPRYVPHIYSNQELKKIFEQSDQCRYCSQVPYRHHVMPLFFRLIYSCGLRLSEARLLKVMDINLDNGVITITNAKQDKHRQVPVSKELLQRLRDYNQTVHQFSKPEDWFLPGYQGKAMTRSNVDKNFRKFLWQARISHGGRGKGPRIHDLRHTFAVHCLRKWVLEEKDLRAYLPVLQAYLGHSSLSDTAYYLHLTADVFPTITERIEASFSELIPKVGEYHETN
jgi:integrase